MLGVRVVEAAARVPLRPLVPVRGHATRVLQHPREVQHHVMNVVRKQKRAAKVSAVRFGNDCPSTRRRAAPGFARGRDEVFHCAVRHG